MKIATIQWKKDWCGWKFVVTCHKVFTLKLNVFRSISVDFIFAQSPPWNCYNFPGMAELRITSGPVLAILHKYGWWNSYNTFNIMGSKQNGRLFADGIPKCIFLNENKFQFQLKFHYHVLPRVYLTSPLVQISLPCAPQGLLDITIGSDSGLVSK